MRNFRVACNLSKCLLRISVSLGMYTNVGRRLPCVSENGSKLLMEITVMAKSEEVGT